MLFRSNVYAFKQASSGTAGNAITWTQAMTLDASGRLGIGFTSMDQPLCVQGASTNAGIKVSDGTYTSYVATITSAGNYGNGSAAGQLYLRGQSGIGFTSNNGGSTSMTLDSSGNLLVGTTNTSPSAGTGLKLLIGADGANTAKYSVVTAATTNSTYSYMHYSTGASAYRMYVGDGGTIYATSTTITAISDQRLKENIRDLDDGLNKVMALKPRKFDWKQGKGKDKKDDRGWIAQEFEQVFPDMIDQWVDPAPEGEEPYKAVNADLIPTLVKAIQEQQAIIEQLKADVAALKGA